MAIWGDLQGLTGVTRGGRGVKKLENWGDVIYGWSLVRFATGNSNGNLVDRAGRINSSCLKDTAVGMKIFLPCF